MCEFILILEIILDLKPKYGGVTYYFLHAKSKKGDKVYINMIQGFRHKWINIINKVLNMDITLYGIHKSTGAFWKYKKM